MKVIFLNKDIYLDERTTDKNFRKAKDFAFSNKNSEELENSAKKIKDITIKKNISISILDTEITGIKGNSRDIIRWIYGIPNNITASTYTEVKIENRDEGQIKRFNTNIYDDVVIVIKEIKDGEYKDFESVKAEIKKLLIDKKKSELIEAKISENWSDDINQLAKNLNTKVNAASNLSFANSNFSVGGNDPAAVGFFFSLKENEISESYVGNRGVFVFQKNEIIQPETSDTEIQSTKQQIINSTNSEFQLNVLEESKSVDQIDMRHMSF